MSLQRHLSVINEEGHIIQYLFLNTKKTLFFPACLPDSQGSKLCWQTDLAGKTRALKSATLNITFFRWEIVEWLWNYTVSHRLLCIYPVFILGLQLVMQYLYYGGTETLHIRNTDIMEVRSFRLDSSESRCHLLQLSESVIFKSLHSKFKCF